MRKSNREIIWSMALGICVLPVAMLLLSAGCTRETATDDHSDADALFRESVRLLRTYTDSLAKATDSATCRRLSENLDSELTKLNFRYPANTDMSLTEGQNDTLYRLTTRYIRIRDKRISNPAAPQDSTAAPQDSTSAL